MSCFIHKILQLTDFVNNLNIKNTNNTHNNKCIKNIKLRRGRRGCDRMVVGFTTTYAISAYHH
jgi:hypothetical protein